MLPIHLSRIQNRRRDNALQTAGKASRDSRRQLHNTALEVTWLVPVVLGHWHSRLPVSRQKAIARRG